jgi:hypothetical protein
MSSNHYEERPVNLFKFWMTALIAVCSFLVSCSSAPSLRKHALYTELTIYKGTVILDKNHIRAYLHHDNEAGGVVDELMAWDPDATGMDDLAGAFRYYWNLNPDLRQIIFRGFPVKDSAGVTVLHVVNPL